jgi:hypothetical protein
LSEVGDDAAIDEPATVEDDIKRRKMKVIITIFA